MRRCQDCQLTGQGSAYISGASKPEQLLIQQRQRFCTCWQSCIHLCYRHRLLCCIPLELWYSSWSRSSCHPQSRIHSLWSPWCLHGHFDRFFCRSKSCHQLDSLSGMHLSWAVWYHQDLQEYHHNRRGHCNEPGRMSYTDGIGCWNLYQWGTELGRRWQLGISFLSPCCPC